MKVKTNGFTLVEVLFVLAIWSILIALSIPFTFSLASHVEERNFFHTFQSDILYAQNVSIGSKEDFIRVILKKDNYTVQNGTGNTLLSRKLPKDWTLDKQNLESISFNEYGVIRQAGTITIRTDRTTYKVIFPIGKGRGYIEER